MRHARITLLVLLLCTLLSVHVYAVSVDDNVYEDADMLSEAEIQSEMHGMSAEDLEAMFGTADRNAITAMIEEADAAYLAGDAEMEHMVDAELEGETEADADVDAEADSKGELDAGVDSLSESGSELEAPRRTRGAPLVSPRPAAPPSGPIRLVGGVPLTVTVGVTDPSGRGRTTTVGATNGPAVGGTPTGNTLQERAYQAAMSKINVREVGGNNRGKEVEAIIKANGGKLGEPWCGDFVAYCYRTAGSKLVSRAWAGAFAIGKQRGVQRISNPIRGDVVIFKFSHVGLFIRSIDKSHIETIEGNTSPSSTSRDSAKGGDGVHVRNRATSLVKGYYRVTA